MNGEAFGQHGQTDADAAAVDDDGDNLSNGEMVTDIIHNIIRLFLLASIICREMESIKWTYRIKNKEVLKRVRCSNEEKSESEIAESEEIDCCWMPLKEN